MMSIKRNFGISGRLGILFAFVAAGILIMTVVSVTTLQRMTDTQSRLVDEDLPALAQAISMSQATNRIATLADRVATTRDREQVKILDDDLAREVSELGDVTQQLDDQTLNQAVETIRSETVELADLKARELSLTYGLKAVRSRVRKNHQKVLVNTATLTDDAYFNAVMSSREVSGNGGSQTAAADEIENGVKKLADVSRIRSKVNQLKGLMLAATTAESRADLETLTNRLKATRATINDTRENLTDVNLPPALDLLIQLSSPEGGALDLRRRYLDVREDVKTAVNQTDEAGRALRQAARDRVADRRSAAESAANETFAAAAQARWLLVGTGIAALAILGTVVEVYVRPKVIKRLKSLNAAMTAITRDELDTRIPSTGTDEIAAMGASLETFKQNREEVLQLEAKQAEERKRSEAEKKRVVGEVASELKSRVGSVVEDVNQATDTMRRTAEDMASMAEQTRDQGEHAATSAHHASENVGAVSSATEQMTGSIQNVGQQGAQTNEIAQTAEARVQKASKQIEELRAAADGIGQVVDIISDIAAKTNMLALNASVEAQRAGEHGRSFAVVAREVKNLAERTRESTRDIHSRISAVQSETQNAAEQVESVQEIVGRLREVSQSVENAVEEQQTAVSEINRNASAADQETRTAYQKVQGVHEAADQTGQRAETLQQLVERLSDTAQRLNGDVEGLVTRLQNDAAGNGGWKQAAGERNSL